EGSGTRSRTGRFVLAGSGSDAPDYPHSLHSTTEGANRAGSRLRIITRRRVIGRPSKIEAMIGAYSTPTNASPAAGPVGSGTSTSSSTSAGSPKLDHRCTHR